MTQPDLVVGVDCSTTATKAVVWDRQGRMVASHRTTFRLSQPRPGWGEQDAEDWWSATAEAIQRACVSVDRSRIAALCLTHQRETFVCLDENGRALRPGMLWLDTRATEQVETHGSDEVHRITGKPPNPTPAWYKLLWLAEHEPETLTRTSTVVDVHGYLVLRLTGRLATSWACADPLGVVDLSTFDYDEGLLAAVGLDRDRVAPLHAPGSVLGSVTDAVAERLGLPTGLPVVAGAGDGQSAQLGAGAVLPGRAYLNLGSGIVSGVLSREYRHAKEYRTLAAAVPGAYTLETFIGGGTINLVWFVENLAGVDATRLGLGLSTEEVLETAAAKLPPGAEGLLCLPYWTGALTPYWDHDARGMMVGLTAGHGKAHLYRALLEGLALEQRLLTSGAEQAVGEDVTDVVALGGGTKSPVWCQIVADVGRRPVRVVQEPESTCLGAGMLAAVAVGLYDSVEDAAEAMSGTARSYEPREETAAVYDRLYDVYRDLYPANREIFRRLAEATP